MRGTERNLTSDRKVLCLAPTKSRNKECRSKQRGDTRHTRSSSISVVHNALMQLCHTAMRRGNVTKEWNVCHLRGAKFRSSLPFQISSLLHPKLLILLPLHQTCKEADKKRNCTHHQHTQRCRRGDEEPRKRSTDSSIIHIFHRSLFNPFVCMFTLDLFFTSPI